MGNLMGCSERQYFKSLTNQSNSQWAELMSGGMAEDLS
jgi:hypothetical protein